MPTAITLPFRQVSILLKVGFSCLDGNTISVIAVELKVTGLLRIE